MWLRRVLVGLAAFVVLLAALAAVLAPRDAPAIRDRAPADFAPGLSSPVIVAFGTSLTARPGWADGLPAALARCFDTPPRLERIAQPGATSQWALSRIGAVIALKPDLVLVEFAINDADITDGLGLAASLDAHQAALEALIDALPDARIILMTMNPASGPRGWKRPFLRRYYAQYAQLAEIYDTGLVDIYARWRALDRDDWGLVDGLHPSREMSERMVLPPLAGMIGDATGRDCAVADPG